MQQILSSLVTIFRNPPPPILPLNIVTSHFLYQEYSKTKDIETAVIETKRHIAKLLYKEFDTDIKVVGTSDTHVYWKVPSRLGPLFDTIDRVVESDAKLLLQLQHLSSSDV